jgi:hypothetical protein
MPNLALASVAFNGVAETLAQDNSSLRPLGVRDEVHHQATTTNPSALADSGTHPGPRMQAVVAGKHVTP